MHIPKVSVVMPVYNGEAYIREAVTSVLTQTFKDFELIVINDGSTDNTAAILQELAADKRVKILNNSANSGLTYTRNKGVANSAGQYIAMLDSDDIALPKRLEKQVDFLDANPGFAMVGSYIDLIEGDGTYIRTQCYPSPPAYIPSLLLFQNNFAQSTVMVRKSALPEECYRKAYPPAEDYDLWVRMAARYKVGNINASLVKYRVHNAGTSIIKANTQRESIKKIVSAQLASIGVTPTPAELELHVQIGLLEVAKQKSALVAAENWLLKLREANLQAGYYPVAAFNTIVAQKWYEVCHSSGLGSWAYRKMFASVLFNIKYGIHILRHKLVCKVFSKV